MYQYHDVANVFPMMSESELDDLAADIKANGLQLPIWLFEGKVIDGRNRLIACERAGVTPRVQTWPGPASALVGFVVSLNLHRRHLSTGQRGIVAAQLANLDAGRHSIPSYEVIEQPDAAALLGVSTSTVQRGRKVIDRGVPELVAAVKAGTVTIGAAEQVAKLPADKQRAIVENGSASRVAEDMRHDRRGRRGGAPRPHGKENERRLQAVEGASQAVLRSLPQRSHARILNNAAQHFEGIILALAPIDGAPLRDDLRASQWRDTFNRTIKVLRTIVSELDNKRKTA